MCPEIPHRTPRRPLLVFDPRNSDAGGGALEFSKTEFFDPHMHNMVIVQCLWKSFPGNGNQAAAMVQAVCDGVNAKKLFLSVTAAYPDSQPLEHILALVSWTTVNSTKRAYIFDFSCSQIDLLSHYFDLTKSRAQWVFAFGELGHQLYNELTNDDISLYRVLCLAATNKNAVLCIDTDDDYCGCFLPIESGADNVIERLRELEFA